MTIEVFISRDSETDKACFIRENYYIYETVALNDFLQREGYEPNDLRWHPYKDGVVIFFPTEEIAVKFRLMF